MEENFTKNRAWSEIRDPENSSRMQGLKMHWIPNPDPQHWSVFVSLVSLFYRIKAKFGMQIQRA
jgi:hypothetical protein